jgi:hypothetical protein
MLVVMKLTCARATSDFLEKRLLSSIVFLVIIVTGSVRTTAPTPPTADGTLYRLIYLQVAEIPSHEKAECHFMPLLKDLNIEVSNL